MSTNPSLQYGVFGTPKVISDTSETEGIFTYDIPNKRFRVAEIINGTVFHYEFTSSALYASAQSSELSIRAGSTLSDVTVVYTRLHPRFHANRGKLFSNSIFVDSWSVSGAEIEFGVFDINETDLTIVNGMTLLYTNRQIHCKVYSDGTVTDDTMLEDQLLEDIGVDPTKGHLCDIQGAWRGVGDIRTYLSNKFKRESECVSIFKALNEMDNLTISNPSLHAGYIARNNGGVPHARSGCFDMSTESFNIDIYEPITFPNSADINTQSTGTVMYAIHIPFTFNGINLTRDSVLLNVSVSSAARARFKVWRIYGYTRLTKGASVPLAAGDWTARTDGSTSLFIDNSFAGLITGFNKTGLTPLGVKTVAANQTQDEKFDYEFAPLFLTHGDVIVIEGYGNNVNMDCAIVVGEEM